MLWKNMYFLHKAKCCLLRILFDSFQETISHILHVKYISFRPHPVLQIGENKKSVLCLCPKLL